MVKTPNCNTSKPLKPLTASHGGVPTVKPLLLVVMVLTFVALVAGTGLEGSASCREADPPISARKTGFGSPRGFLGVLTMVRRSTEGTQAGDPILICILEK
jgi:hypothetical protein